MNPEQLEAIYHDDGPCVMLALAGSGKTRALVHRIARMVDAGVDPASILAVTFSASGAETMNKRLEQLGVDVDAARVGTWHSLCLQILREDYTTWAGWQIDGKDRHKWIVKDTIGYKKKGEEDKSLDWKGADLGRVRRFIGLCKSNLWTWESPEAVDLARDMFGFARDSQDRAAYALALQAYELSQARVESEQLLTFDDFLVFAVRHLRDEDNRRRWADRWSYMLQDECQDANAAQLEIARLLAKDHRNYMVVGDLFQAIYGFRGSSPLHLAGFGREWDARRIALPRNYRSGRAIVRAANGVIAKGRVGDEAPIEMIGERPAEGAARALACTDAEAEAREFALMCERRMIDGDKLSEVFCLYRKNSQSRAVEEALLEKKIPYVIVKGVSFYDRREVKDLLAYLRVAATADEEGDAVRRCLNAPFRYLGQKFVERVTDIDDQLQERGEERDWPSIVERVARQTAGIQQRQRQSAIEWASLIVGLRAAIEKGEEPDASDEDQLAASPAVLLETIVKRTNYTAYVEKEEGAESVDQEGAMNVRELVRVAAKFPTVRALLAHIKKTQNDSKKLKRDKRGDQVVLMTIHASKGLEAEVVWVVGCNSGTLPHSKGDLEEERRLAYVAITRARDLLVMSYVGSVAKREGVVACAPSPFLADAGLVVGTS